MKQLLILSGKGGTGKTTVASAFIKLSDAKAFADCDVDAPNLHLIMGQKTEPAKSYYYGLPTAQIDQERCIDCDLCRQHCRFDAITATDGYRVDPYACEGCGVCEALCPVQAITLKNLVSGDLMRFVDQGKIFSTAKLRMGSGTSGMLVSEVKKQLKPVPLDTELVIIDGSPGIGCPVIASITGVDMVLIVTEPSISGISDMERIIYTAAKFGVETLICVNKYDTNLENTAQIEQYCQNNGLHFVGKIPFDSDAVKAINNGQTIVDVDCTSGRAVRNVYQQVMTQLFKE